MAANKTADAIKLNLRLPKSLHRHLRQEARRNNVSLNTEIVNELERERKLAIPRTIAANAVKILEDRLEDQSIDRAIDDIYIFSEKGLWSPEYARIRHQGGHSPLSPETARLLYSAAKKAKVTPEEYWKRKLHERGIDPDAPYQAPPSTDEPDQE
jgi:HicB family